MVVGLAFVAVVVSSLFAQAMLVRYTADHQPQHRAWAIALAMFALASAALATGDVDRLGQRHLPGLLPARRGRQRPVAGPRHRVPPGPEPTARRVHWGLVLFSGFAAGVLLSCPMEPVDGTAIPVGKDVFGALPRVLAAVGSGVAAVVIIAGAVVSAVALPARSRDPGPRPPRRRQRADRAGHARAVERRAGAGRRRPRRGVRAQPRGRHHDHLQRVRARQRRQNATLGTEISRRVIFNSSASGPPSILGARASPGGKLDGIRYVSVGGVEIGSPVSTKPPSPPQARPHSRPGALSSSARSLRGG